MTTKKLSWNDPQALRALADMQRRIAADMRDLACRMVMEGVAADTESRAQEAEYFKRAELGLSTLMNSPEETKRERDRPLSESKSPAEG